MRHGAQRARWGMASARRRLPPSALRGGLGAALGVAVDAQAQLLADLEERHPLGGHGDALAGARIAPVARLAVLDHEAAEAADLDPLAAPQGVGETLEDGVDHDLRIPPRKARVEGHELVDEGPLGHRRYLTWSRRSLRPASPPPPGSARRGRGADPSRGCPRTRSGPPRALSAGRTRSPRAPRTCAAP